MYDGRLKFLSARDQVQSGLKLCFNQGLWLPVLVLLYSWIDSMAWLARDVKNKDVTRGDFLDWCEKYLLIPPDPVCSADDLYAARCGILHSGIAESKLMRDGKARPLWYGLPGGDCLVPILTASELPATKVQLGPFLQQVSVASDVFLAHADSEATLGDLVWGRADHYYDVASSPRPSSE